MSAAEILEKNGKSTRVVSMPSFEKFDAQDQAYQDSVLVSDSADFWSAVTGGAVGALAGLVAARALVRT
jgi:transketolase